MALFKKIKERIYEKSNESKEGYIGEFEENLKSVWSCTKVKNCTSEMRTQNKIKLAIQPALGWNCEGLTWKLVDLRFNPKVILC